jgi:hypothetical protein
MQSIRERGEGSDIANLKKQQITSFLCLIARNGVFPPPNLIKLKLIEYGG